MRKKIIHNDYPWPEDSIAGFKRVVDFLPRPEELVFRVKTEAVVLPMNEKSLSFYKRYAKKHKIAFEELLCAVLDAYAEQSAAK